MMTVSPRTLAEPADRRDYAESVTGPQIVPPPLASDAFVDRRLGCRQLDRVRRHAELSPAS